MTHPRHFTDYDAFADALVSAAIAGLPQPNHYDDYDQRKAKRQAIRETMDATEETAHDRWQAHIEHMEELYERGVGPSWA